MEVAKIRSILESLLFVSGEPLKISRLVKLIGSEKSEIEAALADLEKFYADNVGGLVLLRKDDEVQLATRPENSGFVDQLFKSEIQEALSPAALEVLSIIAYRSPITRAEIEMIRGVNCSYTIRNLLMRGLIDRVDNPKDSRGYIYKVSFELLKKLGVENIQKLPDFENLSKDERVDSIIKQAGPAPGMIVAGPAEAEVKEDE